MGVELSFYRNLEDLCFIGKLLLEFLLFLTVEIPNNK